jgi:hypothetical protein
MNLWSRLLLLEDRLLRREPDGIACHWCEKHDHAACTGVAIRPRFDTSALDRPRHGSTKPCACFTSDHTFVA